MSEMPQYPFGKKPSPPTPSKQPWETEETK